MLKRKIYQSLLDWKNSNQKKALIVKGARQVGKTYVIRAFGQAEYDSLIEINFLRQPVMKEIFEGELSAEEIFKRISAYLPDAKIIRGKTLLFLDEIQKCSNARTALKFLADEKSAADVDVIASGSLLGLSYGQDADPEVGSVESIPVGYEIPLMMYSLSFEEFLWAYGYDESTIEYIGQFFERNEKVPAALNERYEQLVREFIVVGGMPEVVADFMEYKDFNRVHEIQTRLITDYEDDIAQHAKGPEKVKVRRCYDSIPRQLARENRKFKYSEVEKKSTAKKYGDSIQWLIDANMAFPCVNVSDPVIPLAVSEKENEFKVYLNDTGLLMALFGRETKLAFLTGKLTGFAKGGIYENFAAETLVKKGYSLHYYKPDDDSELEFLIEKNGAVAPIEVKAGNSATKSLNRFIEQFSPDIAYKVIDGNLGKADQKVSLPHYMMMFI